MDEGSIILGYAPDEGRKSMLTDFLPSFHVSTPVLADPGGNSLGAISIADAGIPDNDVLIACYSRECGGKNVSLLPHY